MTWKSPHVARRSSPLMWHQTSPEAAQKIRQEGFRIGLPGAAAGDILPAGINTKKSSAEILIKAKGAQLPVYISDRAKVLYAEDRHDAVRQIAALPGGVTYSNLVDENAAYNISQKNKLETEIWSQLPKTELDFDKRFEAYSKMTAQFFDNWKSIDAEQTRRIREEGARVCKENGIDVVYVRRDIGGGLFGNAQVTDNMIVVNPDVIEVVEY